MLPVLADSRQLSAVAFIISVSSRLRREKGFWQKGTSSVFTVNVINLDDLKKRPKGNSDTSHPLGGSMRPYMRNAIVLLPARSVPTMCAAFPRRTRCLDLGPISHL